MKKHILLSGFILGQLFVFGCTEPSVIEEVKKGNIVAVEEYLHNHGDPNLRNSAGETLLMLAAYYKQPAIVEDLIKAGADVNAERDGHAALEYAFSGRYVPDIDTIELLVEAGANVTNRDLLRAIKVDDINIVKLFLQAGTEIDINQGERLPLIVASRQALGYKTMQFLLKAGADVNAKDANGNTALIAIDYDVLEKTKLLLRNGANVNVQNIYGDTALMAAIVHFGMTHNNYNSEDEYFSKRLMNDAMERIKLLLKAKANVNATDNNGWTALMKASEFGNPETVTLLLKAGADINAKNKEEETAIRIARRMGHTEVVKILKAAGAKTM